MRRRYKRKYLLLKIFLFFILFSTIIGVSYSFLYQSLDISGNVSGNYISENYIITADSNPNLEITSFSTNRWKESGLEKTHYTFTVKNIGNKKIDNFKMIINFNNAINSINIWNYEYTLSTNTLTVINNNYTLQPNEQREVSFIAATSFENLRIRTIKFEIRETSDEVDPTQFVVVFNKTGGWGNYDYQYSVTVTNKTGKKITFWQLEVTLPNGTNLISGWNAIFQESGNILLITCESYNGKLNNNQSTSFGMQLHTDIINFIPSNIRATVR